MALPRDTDGVTGKCIFIVEPYSFMPKNVIVFLCCVAGKTIAGTTDSPTELSYNPSPKEAEIQFILSEIKHYLSSDVEGKCCDTC